MIAEVAVTVRYSPAQGRYEVACRALKKGEIVFTAEPYGYALSKRSNFLRSHSIFENFKKRVCARCIKYNNSGAFTDRCAACSQVWYCSLNCATQHATEEHTVACPIYQGLRGLHKDEVAFLRCVINILVRRHRELASVKPLDGACTPEKTKHVGYSDVEALCEHRDAWAPPERQSWRRVAAAAVTSLKDSPLASSIITEDYILRLVSQIENNSFAMLAGNTAVGRSVLYPRASFFNHSCDPTCERLVGEDMYIQLKTVRDVAAGDEVTISYINENRPRSARRENLASSYHFNCACSRCTEEAESGSAKYSYARSVNNHARKGAKKREERTEKKKADAAATAAASVPNTQVPTAAAVTPAPAKKEKPTDEKKEPAP